MKISGKLVRTVLASTALAFASNGYLLALGATHGSGSVVLVDGVKMRQVPLWRSYLAGCILLGIAPCTAMVLVWGYLARGDDGHPLVRLLPEGICKKMRPVPIMHASFVTLLRHIR